jgi:hypothetical protein
MEYGILTEDIGLQVVVKSLDLGAFQLNRPSATAPWNKHGYHGEQCTVPRHEESLWQWLWT